MQAERVWDASDPRVMLATALLPAGAELTPEWYAARREGIGASDMAAVLGLSSYASPYSLYWSKLGLDTSEDDDETMPQRLGRQDELGLSQIFAEEYPGWQVRTPPGALWRSTGMYPEWMLATPDRLLTLAPGADIEQLQHLLGDGAAFDHLREFAFPMEIKSYGGGAGWGPTGTDEVPLYVAVQVIQQCLIFGAPFGVVAARLNKTVRVYVIHVKDHGELIQTMLADGARFMEHVRLSIEPPVDGHEATADTLRLVYPPKRTGPIDDDDMAEAVSIGATELRELTRLKAQAKRAKEGMEIIKNRIREQLGKSRVGIDKDGAVVAKRSVYIRRAYSVREGTVDQINFTLPGEDDNG